MISNLNIEGSLSDSSFSNVNQTEDVIFLPYPEFLNIILLTTFIGQIYTGLEIEHPIYKTVFCNLCVTLISSLINTVIFPFIKILRLSSLMNANNALCIVFHYSSWCILSILHYLYIIHIDWLHKTFPQTSTIGHLAIVATVLTHALGVAINLTASVLRGWPRKKMLEASTLVIIIRETTHMGTFLLLIGISSYFILCMQRF
jgi:hypothetical protein